MKKFNNKNITLFKNGHFDILQRNDISGQYVLDSTLNILVIRKIQLKTTMKYYYTCYHSQNKRTNVS